MIGTLLHRGDAIWFACLGSPLSADNLAHATAYLAALNYPTSIPIRGVSDWHTALTLTRDPQDAEGLFREFTSAAHADPSPPTWTYVLMETHPTGLQRIEMARAWLARQQGSP